MEKKPEKKLAKDATPEEIVAALERLKGKPLPSDDDTILFRGDLVGKAPGRFGDTEESD